MSTDAPMAGRPVILLTFANDRAAGGEGYLRALAEEQRRLEQALADLGRRFEVVARSNTRVDDLYRLFARYNDRIVVFHYGGHARPDALMFEDDDDGDTSPDGARIAGIAERLGGLPRLALVFLNGCSTGPQVEIIRRHVSAAIVATDQAIVDAVACDFAHRFYDDLTEGRTVAEAFAGAESLVKTAVPDAAAAHRMMRPVVESARDDWPWHLHVDATVRPGGAWRLRDAEARAATSPGARSWVVWAAGAALLVALVALFIMLKPAFGPGADEPVGASPPPPPTHPTVEPSRPPVSSTDGPPVAGAPQLNWHVASDVLDHLLARVTEGRSPADVAAGMPDDRPTTLYDLVGQRWSGRDVRVRPMIEALIDEGLRRVATGPTPERAAELRRIGQLLAGVDILMIRPLDPLPADAADALRDRIITTLLAVRPRPEGDALDRARGPTVPVRVGDRTVLLGATEVTVEQMRTFAAGFAIGAFPGEPAGNVDRYLAAAFARWVGGRLPTKPEFAAAHAPLRPGGECRQGPNADIAAVAHVSTSGRPLPVGGRAPCRGLYDLFGNVAEWTAGASTTGRWFNAGGHYGTGRDRADDPGWTETSGRVGTPFQGMRLAFDPPADAD